MKYERKLDSEFVQQLVRTYQHGTAWAYIADVMPYVVFEVMALGPSGLIGLGTKTAKLRLDDGQVYKLRFEHATHCLELRPMIGKRNGPVVASFVNGVTQEDVWLALHPKAAATYAAAKAAEASVAATVS